MAVQLFTSIPPRRYSTLCVDSWRAAGFHVVSVNHADEARTIRGCGIDVVETSGKSRKPMINTLLSAIEQSGATAVGIINADCRILSGVTADKIAARIDGSMIMGRRLNISEDGKITGTQVGFDAFFFDARALRGMRFPPFSMGQPWWDFCFPIRAHQMGVGLFGASSPILTHVEHLERWTWDDWEIAGKLFMDSVREGVSPFPLNDNLYEMAPLCYQWLRERPIIDLMAPDISALLERVDDVVGEAQQLAADLVAAKDRIASERAHAAGEHAAEKHRMGAEAHRMGAEAHRMASSLSWRITKPLRAFRGMKIARAMAKAVFG